MSSLTVAAYLIWLIALVFTLVANCQSQRVFSRQQARSFLANKTLIVSVVVREPFVIFNKNGPGRRRRKIEKSISMMMNKTASTIRTLEKNSTEVDEIDTSDPKNYSGVAVQVINRLAQMFNFKYRLIRPSDNLFGSLQADGSWTGLMADVYYNRSDIGLTGLSITLERSRAVDFSRAYFVETTSILMPIPEEEKNYFAIFQPFSIQVWILLLITVMGLIMLIQLMLCFKNSKMCPDTTVRPRETKGKRTMIDKGQLSSKDLRLERQAQKEHYYVKQFYYSVSCVVNILLIRDIEDPPRQNSIRILVCIWWLCTIVIVNIYFGILFGQLVVPRLPPSIDTLEELANQNKIKWSVTKGSALYDLFKRAAPDSIYAKIGKTMENVTSADDGIEHTLNEGWAFIREKSILTFKISEYHSRLKQCKMKLAKEDFFSVGFGIAFKKGAPYVAAFNSAIGMMIENGFVARWQSKYWPTKNVYTQCDMTPSEGEPLSMKHFMSIYLVCSLIILFSVVVLLYQSTHEHIFVNQMKPIFMRLIKRIRKARR